MFIRDDQCHFRRMDLNTSEVNNAQKLQYWNLIKRLGLGWWELTEKGKMFATGEIDVPKFVWTYDNKTTRVSLKMINIKDKPSDLLLREDYQRQVYEYKNSGEKNQKDLFK